MLCVRDSATWMVHPLQKAGNVPTLLPNTLGASVPLNLKDAEGDEEMHTKRLLKSLKGRVH
jgi:hypothetical protein